MVLGFLGTQGDRGSVAIGRGMAVEGTPFGCVLGDCSCCTGTAEGDNLAVSGCGGGQPGFTGT